MKNCKKNSLKKIKKNLTPIIVHKCIRLLGLKAILEHLHHLNKWFNVSEYDQDL